MFSPVIMLLLGGFTLAAALSKHHIAKAMASSVLSRAGSQPHRVVLANMFVSTFASMWISNVAAPVLCFELIKVRSVFRFCFFGECPPPPRHSYHLFTLLAYSSKPTSKICLCKNIDLGHSNGCKCWWNGK